MLTLGLPLPKSLPNTVTSTTHTLHAEYTTQLDIITMFILIFFTQMKQNFIAKEKGQSPSHRWPEGHETKTMFTLHYKIQISKPLLLVYQSKQSLDKMNTTSKCRVGSFFLTKVHNNGITHPTPRDSMWEW